MKAARQGLIWGGPPSEKSRYAQQLAEAQPGDLVYIATAQSLDAEMADRIARHKADRGPRWRTVECPLDLAHAIQSEQDEGRTLLVDCLTLWLSNLMFAERDCAAAGTELVDALRSARGTKLLVANERGQNG